jgi:ribosomal protein S8
MYFVSKLLTEIRNGQNIKLLHINFQNVKFCLRILDTLVNMGYIRGYKIQNKNSILILLKYHKGYGVIDEISCISKPNKRVYITVQDLWKIGDLKNIFLVLNTSSGLLTHNNAFKKNKGGEVLFKII